MILPEHYVTTLLLMILSTICLGSWVSTYRFSRLRFELYYFDFALGLALAATALAFTLGSMGFDGFSFLDDILHAGKREDFYAFAAGVIFTLANMLLMAAVAVAGMTVAFPISAGIALILGVIISRFRAPTGNPILLIAGCAAIFAAVILASAAYRFIHEIRHEVSARAGRAKSTKRPVAIKGIVIAVLSGLLMAWFFPLLAQARAGELGLGPYSVCAIIALGSFLSTFVFNLFFMNLPTEGEPVDFMEYFKAKPVMHGWAILGGVIWGGGLTSFLVAISAETVRVSPVLRYGLTEAPALLAIIWGALYFKEFKDGDSRIKAVLGLMFVLFAVGVTLASMAHGYNVRRS